MNMLQLSFFLAVSYASLSWAQSPVQADGTYYIYCTQTELKGSITCQAHSNGDRQEGLAGSVFYLNELNKTGWDRLSVNMAGKNESTLSLQQKYFGLGFGEGYTMFGRIYDNYKNFGRLYKNFLKSDRVKSFIKEQIEYMESISREGGDNNTDTTEYREVIGGVLSQLKGLSAGYQAALSRCKGCDEAMKEWGTFDDFYYMNFKSEFGDVNSSFDPEAANEWLKLNPEPTSCSALIKLTPDDILFGHITWTSYSTMMRVFKEYNHIDQRGVTFSGYPGVVHSRDDWYMTARGLGVMETTISISNGFLYKNVNPRTVAAFIRAMAANYLATTPEEWTKLFINHNSGTYNNQWMIVDLQHAEPSALKEGTFWVVETIPIDHEARDMTAYLNETSYWPSFNMPFFPDIYEKSGTANKAREFGNFFDYNKTNRAVLFRRLQKNVTDVYSMKRVLRYNNYREDNDSIILNCTGAKDEVNCKHSAMLAIAPRGDLNEDGEEEMYGVLWRYFARREHTGTDTKITSHSLMRTGERRGWVISGPTNEQQPTFNFTSSPWNWTVQPRHALPDTYSFPFILLPPKEEDDIKTLVGIIIGVAGGVVVLSIIVFLVYMTFRRSRIEGDAPDTINDYRKA